MRVKQYDFTPDYTNLLLAARNQAAPRLPLYEHAIGARMIEDIMGSNPYPSMESPDKAEQEAAFADFWAFWRRMGYDTASFERCITEMLPGGGALGRHEKGSIKDRADFERYPWDELPELYFSKFASSFRALEKTCPPGMKAVGGVGNGIFECVQDVVGYMDLCYIREDDPELFADLFRRMGDVHVKIWARFLEEFSGAYCVLRFGDDLGFNISTLLAADDIRQHVIPQYRRITDLVHKTGRPFLLHSCGCIFRVFDDIIRDVNIDAKHSNEDSIAHFSVWAEKYGDRIGNFGGIDTDVLCRQSPEVIHEYVLDSIRRAQGHGGIAFGSGNSIPDYVPTAGYLAMIETVRDYRGDRAV
jgi:uroporphyrinogen decarboxylase